jgi:hypothetical protein
LFELNYGFTFITDQAQDSELKCKDLEKSVSEFQTILKEASHRYGALEDQYEKDKEGEILSSSSVAHCLDFELYRRKRTALRSWYMLVKCLFEGVGDRGHYYSIII